MSIILIGAGPMAIAYAKALQHMGHSFQCLGRGSESAARFLRETGVAAGTGPLEQQLQSVEIHGAMVIVAVSINQLAPVCQMLLQKEPRGVLVEKPGGVDLRQMAELAAQDMGGRIRVAYNRRFFKSTQAARQIIADDGGAQSVHFEFTELPDRLAALGVHPPEVLANLPYANSSHVFDMAFFLGQANGDLSDVSIAGAERQGGLVWHPDGARFASCGTIGERALYSCMADWQSGGNWSVEITTSKRRLRLKPLETLTEQLRETFAVQPIALPEEPKDIKPGLHDMLVDFMENGGAQLPTMRQQVARMGVFAKMLRREH